MSGSELIALGSHYSRLKGIGSICDHIQAPCREEDGLPWIALLLSFHNRETQGNGSSSGICLCDTSADVSHPASVWTRLSQYSWRVCLLSLSWCKSVWASHTALQSKTVDGCSPLSTGPVLIWVSVSSRGLPASLSPSYRPWSTEQGEISHQAPPLMAQLYFYCKISVIPAVQGPARLLQWFPLPTFATVNSLLVLEFWYTGPSTEKRKKTPDHRSTDDPRRALFPWIHELYSNRSTDNQDRGLALNPKDLF